MNDIKKLKVGIVAVCGLMFFMGLIMGLALPRIMRIIGSDMPSVFK